MSNKANSFYDVERACLSLITFVWEKSLQHAK